MGESRPASSPADPARTASGLTPIQQAYSDYVTHAVGCDVCRSIDAAAGPCVTAEVLWEAYKQLRRAGQTPARF